MGQVRDQGLQRAEAVIERQQGRAGKATTIASPALVSTAERGSVGPVFISPTVTRLRQFATVFGLMPSSRLHCARRCAKRTAFCLGNWVKQVFRLDGSPKIHLFPKPLHLLRVVP